MALLLRVLALTLLLGSPTLAQAQPCPGVTTALVPFATERLTVGAIPVALTAGVYQTGGQTAVMAQASLEGGTIRYDVVGTPTAELGHPLSGSPPQPFTICGIAAIRAFRAIQVATSALLTLTYYRVQ